MSAEAVTTGAYGAVMGAVSTALAVYVPLYSRLSRIDAEVKRIGKILDSITRVEVREKDER